ncbi:MAG: glycosyltransferase family 4 protein [Caldilineaceae bacterium]|nr:glycosyltransferase family 4 protein [Caldilineaceae bacterium]
MTADTVGGVWIYAIELASQLSGHGHEIVLATMGQTPTAEQQAAAAQIPRLQLYASNYKLEWMENPWADVEEAGAWLLAIAQAVKPDIIHLNNYAHGSLPWPAPVLMVGHSCVLSWWRAVHGVDAPAGWETYRRQVRAGLQSADVVVAPTQAMLHALQQHYGHFRNSVAIYNGCQAQKFRSAPKEEVIFSIGRLWDDAKNIAALETVAPQLAWPIYVAGASRHPDGGERQLSSIQPLGVLARNDVIAWLSKTAIYALPARYEPFGLSALEAALSGCALVLSEIPTLCELWEDHALFVPPNDPDALRDALSTLMADAQLRKSLGEAARRRAFTFTSERMAKRYLMLYQLLNRSRAYPTPHALPLPSAVPPMALPATMAGESAALRQQ